MSRLVTLTTLIILLTTTLSLLACGATPATPTPPLPTPVPVPAPLTFDQLKNAEYPSEFTASKQAKLVNGKFEEPAAPGSASKIVVMLGEWYALGDLNGDGAGDAVVILIESGGGSGAFYKLVAVVNDRGMPKPTTPITLGDRVKIKSVALQAGEIIVQLTRHAPTDPLCCPTQETTQKYRLQGDKLVLLSSEVTSTPASVTTTIIKYVPGQPTGEEKEGRCWVGSIAAPREGAWRCMIGSQIQDPCFTLEAGKSVVCGADPTANKPGYKLKLTEPLPAVKLPANLPAAWGWMVQLADGTVCTPATGAMGFVNNKPVRYYCAGGTPEESIGILDELKAGTPWTAEKAIITRGASGPALKSSQIVPVRTAWQ